MNLEYLLTKSYTPISHFNVAVIIKGKLGNGYGVNVECHSLKDGICAEGAAFSNYFANGYKKEDIEEIIVMNDSEIVATPCFLCRQYISDLVSKDVIVRCFNKNKKEEKYLVKNLCVHPFGENNFGGIDA